MKLQIRHETRYDYAGTVSHSVNQLCIVPRDTLYQQCLNNALKVEPAPEKIFTWQDNFGNTLAHFSIEESHDQCVVESVSLVETSGLIMPELPKHQSFEHSRQRLACRFEDDDLFARMCLLPSQHVSRLDGSQKLVRDLLASTESSAEFAEQLMSWIFNEFDYDPSFSTVVTTGQKAWDAKRGVCQDFAHVALAILREAGIPARYVSGYLETLPPPGQKKLQGSDASHAWFSIYCPEHGWFDFDPTNDKRPDQQYVTTAWGRDYADVAPLKGVVYGGGSQSVSVAVDVNRVDGALYVATDEKQA